MLKMFNKCAALGYHTSSFDKKIIKSKARGRWGVSVVVVERDAGRRAIFDERRKSVLLSFAEKNCAD